MIILHSTSKVNIASAVSWNGWITLTFKDTQNVTDCHSYLVVERYDRQHRVLNQIRNGAKLLQLTFDNINFIDSVIFSNSAFCVSKDIRIHRVKEGLFSSPV